MSPSSDVLVIDGVTKRFGRHVAVDDLSLRIPRGCIYGFLGPNGAGKTTTIRMVMSILLPDSGTITVLGHPNAESVKDRLGYLPEEKGLYKKMKVGEIVTYFGRLKGMDARTARGRAKELLEKYGLADWMNKRCEALSKGMGQKVQVLGTLLHEPELVILDEPFSGLDPVNRQVLQELILDIKRQGRTVIFSTHVMEQAEQLCDYIFLMNRGRKILDGTLSDVRRSGDQAIRIDHEGDVSFLHDHPGVKRINESGNTCEVFLDAGADPQALLQALVGRVRIRRFDLREPSLHDVFVRAVGGKTDD